MTDQNKTAILAIIDRSGSMQPMSEAVVGGFNQLVEDQRKEPGEATMSLVQFDDVYEVVYLDKPLEEVEPLVHVPRNGTALFDAMGRGIVELGEKLAALPEDERPGQVIVVVMTDGQENCSKEWDQVRLKDLIKEQTEKYNWEFVFTAANIDAAHYAQTLGIAHSAGYAATGAAAAQNLGAVSRGISNYRKGGGYKHGG